jgi:hypothetical protein
MCAQRSLTLIFSLSLLYLYSSALFKVVNGHSSWGYPNYYDKYQNILMGSYDKDL